MSDIAKMPNVFTARELQTMNLGQKLKSGSAVSPPTNADKCRQMPTNADKCRQTLTNKAAKNE